MYLASQMDLPQLQLTIGSSVLLRRTDRMALFWYAEAISAI